MNRKTNSRRQDRRLQKGQVLVIVVFALTALVAFIGLVVDLGLVFIQYGRLRRAVDSAAIAASLQYRENYTLEDLKISAGEFLRLNSIDVNDEDVVITVCDLDGELDSDLETGEELALCDGYGHGNNNGTIDESEGELRKFVHVTATSSVQLAFMRVLGFTTIPLGAEAVSEAASLDLVLVIDRSDSMTQDAPDYSIERDPRYCNAIDNGDYTGDCEPFDQVKKAAVSFICGYMFFPYDRVAVIPFDQKVHTGADFEAGDPGNRGLYLAHTQNLTSDACGDGHLADKAAVTFIQNLTVYNPQYNVPASDEDVLTDYTHTAWYGGCRSPHNDGAGYRNDNAPCRVYDPPWDTAEHFAESFPDDLFLDYETIIPSEDTERRFVNFCDDTYNCPDLEAPDFGTSNIGGGLFEAANEFARTGSRPEALWVVILLTDGAANSSLDVEGSSDANVWCPSSTHEQPYCNDGHPENRHCLSLANDADYSQCTEEGGVRDESEYDADDFARDMADFVGVGQQAVVFTIGLGDLTRNCTHCEAKGAPSDPGALDAPEQLMQYIADVGNGEYYYAPTADQLEDIFRRIADKISVRLTH